MKKKVTKYLGITLTVAMLTGLLAGCGNSSGGSTSDAGNAEVEQSTTAEADAGTAESTTSSDVPTFTIATVRWSDSWPTDFLSQGFMKSMEEQAGIHIEWQIYYASDWGEQKSLLLASGDLPDAFLGSICLTASDVAMNKEYFVDLTDKIADMPKLTAAMEKDPSLRAICTSRDGRIYSLPKRLAMRPKVDGDIAYINQDWLDNLGLEAPTNIDEFEQVLLAFKNEDADGDGDPNNEFPITGASGDVLRNDLRTILQPFGLTDDRDGNYMGLDADGKPVFRPAEENYKDAVIWMRKLWEEGLIDPEKFTQDGNAQSAKTSAEGGSHVGVVWGWTADAQVGTNIDQFVPLKAIAGPDGKHYVESAANFLDIADRELLITTSCEDPDALLRWADNFYDNLPSLQMTYGDIGEEIADNGDGTYTVLAPSDGTSLDGSAWSNSLRDFGPKYMDPSFEENVILPPDQGDGAKRAEDAVNGEYVTIDYDNGFPMVQYTEEELARLSTIKADITPYVEAQYAHWVTEGGIEEEWDAYIEQLKAMGLDEYVQIHTTAYDFFKNS